MDPPRLQGFYLQISKGFLVPQRFIIVILAALAVFNAYTMRVCLSLAIVRMVHNTDNKPENKESCHFPSDKKQVFVIEMEQFNWTSADRSDILGAFYYGYVVSHIPGGIWAENYGGKHILGIGTLWTAVFTLLTPIVALKFEYWGIFILRILIGVGEGVTFPAVSALLSEWVPKNERSRLGTLAFSGILFGSMIGNAITGWLIGQTKRWDVVFYFFGGVGVLWYVIYQLLVYSSPETHPFISDKEYYFLEREVGKRETIPAKDVPWLGILTNLPTLSLIVAQLGHDWGLFSMVIYLPQYLDDILKFSVKKNGALTALTYMGMWCMAMLSAAFCDWLIKKDRFSIGFLRKFFTGIAAIGPAIFLLLACYSGCNRWLAVTCFTIGMGFMGCFYPGMRVNALDLTHKYAGILMAFINGIGAISGIVSPKVVKQVLKNETLAEWRLLYWITFMVLLVTFTIYATFGSGKFQDFNEPDYVFPGCCKKRPTQEP